MVLLMKSQKRSRLFRALLCSSAAVTAVSQAIGQDGITRVSSQPPMPDPVGSDGVSSTASPDGGVAQVPTYALPDYIPPNDPGAFRMPSRTTWQDELGPRFLLETRIGEWLGSADQGQSAVNVMLPFSFESSRTLAFLDARGVVSWDGGATGSVGGGLRWFDEFRNRITGISGFWDYDDGNRRSYNQAGVSFESIGRWFDFRANGYFALGNRTNVISTALTGNFDTSMNPTRAEAIQGIETSYSGFNVEVGGPTPILGRYGFESYIGGYYFDTPDARSAGGVSLRSEVHVTDDLRLGINVTDDNVFGTNVFGTVVLTLPDGRPKQFFRPRQVREKILDRVERRYRVTTDRTTRDILVPVTALIPPLGGGNSGAIPISNVIVVDPNSPTNGSGTFADPFNTFVSIANPDPNTLTLVRSGNVEGQYNLSGNSLLLSESFLNTQNVMVQTSLGTLRLPALNANATTPIWSNTAGNASGTSIVNILGDNTEVAGFIFDGRTTSGLANSIIQASGVQGVSIHDNTFRNYHNAINLQNVTGEIATFNPTSIYSNQFLGSNGQSYNGFIIENDGPVTLDLELGATDFNLARSNGTAVGNFAYGNSGEDANGNGRLDSGEDANGDFVLDSGTAYSITARNRAIINAQVVGNVAGSELDTDGDGILDTEDLNGNGRLDVGEDRNNNGVLDLGEDLNNNGRFDIGSGTGFVVNAGATQSTINLTLRGNVADRNIGDGVYLAANSSLLNADQIGEDVNGNGRLDGFEDLNRNGILDLTEDRNGNGLLDLSEDANGNGVLDAGEDTNGNGVLDFTEDRNGNGRLDLSEDVNGNNFLDYGEDANEDLNGNGMLDSGEDRNGDGFLNLGNRDGQLAGGRLITGNVITRNGGDGIRIESTNFADVNLRLTQNSIGTQLDGSTGNRSIGINASADSGTIDLNLGFLYFEDVNFNGILDAGEDQNGNGILDSPPATPEDTNQNGVIDAGEDRNGNGILDSPFDNGNEIVANAGGGVIFDLSGTATGQINAVGNAILGTGGGILDFTIIGGTDTSTMPFDLINASTQGIDITSFDWNLGSVGLLVDSTTVPFAPVNGTETTTGLQMVNGGSSTASVPNFATRVDLVFNSFNPINNLLDTGEDLNANGILDAGEDLPDTFSFNLDVDFANGTDPVLATDLLGTRVGVIFSTGQQITGRLQADPLIPANAIFVPETTNLAPTNGVGISAADNATLSSSFLFANQINNFSGNGLSAIASGAGNIENLIVRSNTLTGNFGIGASFQTSTTTTAQLTASLFENNLSANTLGGITAMANGGTLTLNDVERNNLNSGGSGIQLTSTQGGDLSARITENQVSGSMIMNGSTGHGVEVTADAATVTLLELADNLINSNAGDGVTIQALNGGTLFVPTSEDVNGNGILDAGEDVSEDTNSNGILDPGEDLNTDGVLNAGNGNGRLDRGITNNSISNNIGNSFSVNATAASTIAPSSVTLGTVSNNQLLANSVGTGGFMLNGVNSVINASFTSNTVIGNPVGNPTAGPGFLLTSSGGSFDVNVGGPNVADGNVFSQLSGAGIGFNMTGGGTGSFSIRNNEVTAIADDPITARVGFNGQGINVTLGGSRSGTVATAVLTRSEISDNLVGDFNIAALGTAESGIRVRADDQSTIQDLLIARNMVGNAGNNDPIVVLPPMQTTVPNFTTASSGIQIDRVQNARFDVVNPRTGDIRAITIDGNIVRNNGAAGTFVDGLQFAATGGSGDTSDLAIRNNEFSGNSGEGIHLHAQGDAIMLTDMTANLIENNALNGVSLEGLELLGGDLESQGGTWVQNVIRNNALSGIDILGVSGDINALIIGQNGSNPFTGMSFGNEITGNTLDGIRISSGGNVQINNNLISGNGEDGIDIGSVGVGFRTALIQNNQVTNNARTGLELDNTSTMTVVALGNTFSSNGGRGVDILNRGSGTANLRFGDGTFQGMNRIVSNAMEGFYVVNTASFTQIQDPTSTALDATGAVTSTPDMVLDVNRNEVLSNNAANTASLFPGGGFSLLVGTSGSSSGMPGATDVADTTGDVNGDGSGRGETVGVGANSALFGNGRVNARVINNTFEGNFGDDVYMQSFISTVDPATGGTWNATVFAPALTYQTDPLARLNLVFGGNVGNSLNITNAAATYTNADPVFKSRLATQNPPGPFLTAGGRNAQRTQARTDGFGRSLSPATGPDNGSYQYSGQGVSTFRVEGNFDVSGFQTGDGFTIDNGIFDTGAAWGVAAPGTFQFDDPFFGIAP